MKNYNFDNYNFDRVNWGEHAPYCVPEQPVRFFYFVIKRPVWSGIEALVENKTPLLGYIGDDGDMYCSTDELMDAGLGKEDCRNFCGSPEDGFGYLWFPFPCGYDDDDDDDDQIEIICRAEDLNI